MPKMTGVQGIKIYNKINEMFGKEAAEEFSERLPLSKSADYIKKFKWSKDVCNYLEKTYNSKEIELLRMSCSCDPSEKEIENTRLLYNKSKSIDEFCETYNNQNIGRHMIWHENGDAIYFSYPACYCSCVKRVDEQISKTWCLCSVGYTKKMFDYVLNAETKVELLESIKLGDSRCVMKITKPQ